MERSSALLLALVALLACCSLQGCSGKHKEVDGCSDEGKAIFRCISKFSAAEWRDGCKESERFDCDCPNDDGGFETTGISGGSFCCGSTDHASALQIWACNQTD
eukprot:gnl/TRDRNA2_/TRDRNA2_61827_c0_seq1.p1 gnl/TRDRNA2_/TRDRNA2_61827_c0~~gnl/TRDRNA2_/TRDRNA2_61827_c0_seq1.p1  ORF type:complete len:104 (+),score=19.23 gnl/TRDRNA2_/TRDRNA2_61827_c0_seq1:81-392(+)